jgi:hypothetical protein
MPVVHFKTRVMVFGLLFSLFGCSAPAPGIVVDRVEIVTRNLFVDTTVRLQGFAYDTNSVPIAGKVYQWLSSDPTVATIDATGKVRGLKAGSTNIKLVVEDKFVVKSFEVLEPLTLASQSERVNAAPVSFSINVNGVSIGEIASVDMSGPVGWNSGLPASNVPFIRTSSSTNDVQVPIINALSGSYQLTFKSETGIETSKSVVLETSQALNSPELTSLSATAAGLSASWAAVQSATKYFASLKNTNQLTNTWSVNATSPFSNNTPLLPGSYVFSVTARSVVGLQTNFGIRTTTITIP